MSLLAESRDAPAQFSASLWPLLRSSLRENSPLILFTALFGLAPFVLAARFALPHAPYPGLALGYLQFMVAAAVALFTAFAIWYLYHARIRKVPKFQAEAWRRIRSDFLRPERLMLALPVVALWPITASAFSYMKSVIPLIQPFHLDQALYEWDRMLHFGADPWRLLQPLLGYAWVTFAVNLGYTMWFLVLQAAFVLQSGAIGDRRRRMQFLLSMALAWALIGNLGATLLSSAGPCYYDLVTGGPSPYAPLTSYLHGVANQLSLSVLGHEVRIPLTALMLQDMLWQSYLNGDFGLAMGISAAPSMHIASSWIVARLAWSMGRRAAIFGSLFLAVIFVGSIHLGWHYALDGYLSIAGAWIIWRLVGCLLDRSAVQRWLWPETATLVHAEERQ
jgi:PAP2 superfamily